MDKISPSLDIDSETKSPDLIIMNSIESPDLMIDYEEALALAGGFGFYQAIMFFTLSSLSVYGS